VSIRFATLHPTIWEELHHMARTADKKLQIDFGPVIEYLGLEYFIKQVGIKPIIDQIGVKRVVSTRGDWTGPSLT
jgi:hypothetical protein